MPGGHKFGANGIKFDMNVPDNGLNNIQSVLGHLEKFNFWVMGTLSIRPIWTFLGLVDFFGSANLPQS